MKMAWSNGSNSGYSWGNSGSQWPNNSPWSNSNNNQSWGGSQQQWGGGPQQWGGSNQQWGSGGNNAYQSLGNYGAGGPWSNDMPQQENSWSQQSSSSAGSYSYFNKPGGNQQKNQQSSWNFGGGQQQQQWGSQGKNTQKWSTAADDGNSWNFTSPVQQTPLGWGGGDGRNEKGKSKAEHSGPPAKKRARNDGANKKKKSIWNDDYDYSFDANHQAFGQGSGWGGKFGGRGNFYNQWSQIPQPGAGTGANWRGGYSGDFYDEDQMYEHEFGEYQGGYEDPNEYYKGSASYENVKRERPPRDSVDDKLLYKKHRTLTQDKQGRRALANVVKNISNALHEASKAMATELMEELNPKSESKMDVVKEDDSEVKEDDSEVKEEVEVEKGEEVKKDGEGGKDDKEDEKKELPPQIFLGVVRVGPAVRKLITTGESELGAEFVAIFNKKPTRTYFFKLASLLHQNIKSPMADKITITPDETNNTILIEPETSTCPYPIKISFTSPEYSPEWQAKKKEEEEEREGDDQPKVEEEVEPKDLLNEKKCIEAMAKIRRVRWSMRKIRAEIELPVVRVLLDLREGYSGWKHLSPYAAEVLVHSVMEKLAKDVRESELSFSRLFVQCLEMLAQGMVLKGGPGLKDPCESQPVDVFSYLEPQEAEDLTRGAQNALRLASFKKLKTLLKMDS